MIEDDAQQLWAEAARQVRESPHYGGLELAAQPGLLPLGVDPKSGFAEFVHVQTGVAPNPCRRRFVAV